MQTYKEDRRQQLLLGCDVLQVALDYREASLITMRKLVEVARQWARGEATEQEVRAAGMEIIGGEWPALAAEWLSFVAGEGPYEGVLDPKEFEKDGIDYDSQPLYLDMTCSVPMILLEHESMSARDASAFQKWEHVLKSRGAPPAQKAKARRLRAAA